ncbi:hypothetical protein Ari01nite_79360 [Paractinoplanes rishiriensis]|uniref:Uncharacterized protein n=1 Tax=Paractinoplanes rishiriensis TaxID=1050105 RepID=A0A919K3Z1_9ACTN|nr:hypothetical protein Ari01nite_79360 [Actinoplanes rishiriensis]
MRGNREARDVAGDQERSEFFAELDKVVGQSGRSADDIGRATQIARSRLSEMLGGKLTRVPAKAVLAAILEACGLGTTEIGEWEVRRLALADFPSTYAEVAHLTRELDRATENLDARRADEQRLRDRLADTTGQRDGLRASAAPSPTQRGKLAAAGRHIEALAARLAEAVERARAAEIAVAGLRSDLSRAEFDLLYEDCRRPPEADGTHGDLGEAQGLMAAALSHLRGATQQVHEQFSGRAGGIRHEVVAYLHSSCAELENSLRALDEFTLRSTQHLHTATGAIAVLSERLRQTSAEMAECLRTLTDCRQKIEALDDFGCSELGELAHRAAATLESSQGTAAAAARALEDG